LHAETEPEVLSAICASLGRLGEEEAIDHLRPHLSSEEATVRAAALEACLRLVGSEAERTSLVELGLADASASVRRRTYLAAAALPGVELLPWAMRCRKDGDPHLRRLAYVTLASESDPAVASMALDALLDPDEGVRSAVASLLQRRLGNDVEALASLAPVERRREVRALEARLSARETEAAPEEGIAFEEIEAVLMTALRGTVLADLAATLGRAEAEVASAVQRYLGEGRIVLRGSKLYLP
jgi:HEAT repeat protein